MAKAAESKPLDLEEDVEPIKEEIKKPRSEPLGSSIGKPKKEEKKPSLEDFKERFDIYTRKDPLARTRWFSNRKRLNELSKDTPYGNDYTTNFAQAPDSPRYPDEDKGYKSETFVGGKKRVENSNTRKARSSELLWRCSTAKGRN